MPFIETWDETKPAGTRAINLGDDDIREFKRAIRERLQFGGMYFPSTDDSLAGEHSYVRMAEQSSNPTATANKGFFFTKDVSGITEAYYMDSTGNVIQLTTDGKILLTSLSGYSTRGDMIRGGTSGWEKVALGSNGQVWKSNGTDAAWGDITFQTAATQAEMEAASSLTAPVTPGRTQYHPGVAKAWCKFNGTGTPAMTVSHNMDASITDNGVGDWSVSITTDFSSANYAVSVCAEHDTTNNQLGCLVKDGGQAAGTLRIFVMEAGNNGRDSDGVHIILFGDQA